MTDLLTVAEFAKTLGVSPRTILREINDGALPYVQVRGRRRIDQADAQAYIARQKVRRERLWPSTLVLRDLLGHTTTAETSRYSHLMSADMRAGADRMAEAMSTAQDLHKDE